MAGVKIEGLQWGGGGKSHRTLGTGLCRGRRLCRPLRAGNYMELGQSLPYQRCGASAPCPASPETPIFQFKLMRCVVPSECRQQTSRGERNAHLTARVAKLSQGESGLQCGGAIWPG